MLIRSVRHRGLRTLLEQDDARYLRASQVDRVKKILTALVASRNIHDFVEGAPPGWRVTFVEEDGALNRLDLEDYH